MIPRELRRRSLWRSPTWLLFVIPTAVTAIAMVAAAAREYRASTQYQRMLDQMASRGEPVDNQTLSSWYEDRTSRDASAAVARVFKLASNRWDNQLLSELPFFGEGWPWTPEQDWPDEPRVDAFLRTMQPVLADLHAISQAATPVWQPLVFDGYQTLLEPCTQIRGVMRLLTLDFHSAIYHQQQDRALRDLQSMSFVNRAFDWRISYVDPLVVLALRGMSYSALATALHAAAFDQDGLLRVREFLSANDDSEIIRRDAWAAERALMLSSLADGQMSAVFGPGTWIFQIPSVRLRLLQEYDKRPSATSEDRARAGADLLTALIDSVIPAVDGFAQAQTRMEVQRRLVLTAVGIKQYQLQHAAWPTTLHDLADVGLSAAVWTIPAGADFGYEVAADRAYVWSYNWNDLKASTISVPATRPQPQPARDWPDSTELVAPHHLVIVR